MNMTVTLPYKTHDRAYDIVVVGGGTAGAIAAIAAAESGKDVLIIERGYALGGSSTTAQVTPLMTTRLPGNVCNSYIGKRMQAILEDRGYTAASWNGMPKTLFSPVTLTVVLEEMCRDAGVDILYGASYVHASVENERIDAVFVQTLDGLLKIGTSFVIDGTGDAQVAYTCGCPTEAGDPENNNVNQNMSLRFAVNNVDIKAVNAFLKAHGEDADPECEHTYMAHEWKSEHTALYPLFKKAVEDGELEYSDGVYFQTFTSPAYGRGMMYFNCPEAPHCRNTTDAFEVSQGVADCRAAAVRVHRFLQKHVGGFENSTIVSFAGLAGIRESRRIVGQYWLTIEDYNARAKFKDGIAQSAYPVDVHGKTVCVHPNTFQKGEFFEVPYGCVVAKGVNNLLVAGRCSSASFWAQSAIRIQLVCHALGEAAGIGASMALDMACNAGDVDGALVRAEMIARGGTFAPVE